MKSDQKPDSGGELAQVIQHPDAAAAGVPWFCLLIGKASFEEGPAYDELETKASLINAWAKSREQKAVRLALEEAIKSLRTLNPKGAGGCGGHSVVIGQTINKAIDILRSRLPAPESKGENK